MTRKILDSTLESTSFNIIFQVFLRCTTFLLNAFVLRYLTQAVVGVMNVRLLLLESTILFLSCEAFRRAALSQTESHSWPQIINLVWLTVPLSVVVSLVFSFIWLYILSVPSPDITPHYAIGVWSISVSCVIEMLAEPLYIVSQAFLFTKLKIVIESLAILVRTLIFVTWIVVNSSQAVIAFSAAQIAGKLLCTLGYYIYFYAYIKNNNELIKKTTVNLMKSSKDLKDDMGEGKESGGGGDLVSPRLKARQSSIVGFDEPFPFVSLLDFLPRTVEGQVWVIFVGEPHRVGSVFPWVFLLFQNWIHPNSAQLTWSFLKQSFLKQILTEGERYVMTLFSVMTFNEQGMYDVVNNIGSLAARFLFRPVEDSLYFYFTQSVKRDVNIKDQNQERMKEVSAVLGKALHCIGSVGLVIFIFGQSYATLLLYLYGGETVATGHGPGLLRTHSFSVLLLGINGITECYTFSTMTAQQLNKYNYIMAVFSILFLTISWGLTKMLGGIGFILANCCIMSARIAHSMAFIKSRYTNTPFQPLTGLLPNKYLLLSLSITLFITKLSESYCQSLPHFFIGTICFVIVTLVWGFQERELITIGIKRWRNGKSKEE